MRDAAYQAFDQSATQIAQSAAFPHNYSSPIAQGINAARTDEASAQLAGWNALLSRERQWNPNVGLDDMFKIVTAKENPTPRVLDFVEFNNTEGHAQPKAGLTPNADLTLAPTPENIRAEGHYYFDRPADQTRLGFHGDSDYANNYGAYFVGRAIDIERTYVQPGSNGQYPPIETDLQPLKLSEEQMERDGITITSHPNARQPYIDGSAPLPPQLHHFDNTSATHQYVPARPEAAPTPAEYGQSGTVDFSDHRQLSGLLDRMIAASDAGDWAAFREAARGLGNRPTEQELQEIKAQGAALADRQEQQAAWQAAPQQEQQDQETQQGPVMRISR